MELPLHRDADDWQRLDPHVVFPQAWLAQINSLLLAKPRTQ